jgi:methionine synthase II (cobalamin-independent)
MLEASVQLTTLWRQILNEASSADCVWQQFCNPQWRRLKSDEGQWWKERYLLWLRPRLNQYAKAQPCSAAGSDHHFRIDIIGDRGELPRPLPEL